jgi:hypothetical protein
MHYGFINKCLFTTFLPAPDIIPDQSITLQLMMPERLSSLHASLMLHINLVKQYPVFIGYELTPQLKGW